MRYLLNLKWEMLLFSVLSIVVGVLMFLQPSKIITAISILLAVILFVMGIKNIFEFWRDTMETYHKYKLVVGILFIVAGIFVIVKMNIILSIITYAVGIIIIISGLMKLENAFDLKKMDERWVPLLVFSILCIVLGILILFMPMNHNDNGTITAGDFFIKCAGAIFAFTGLVDLVTTLTVSSKIKSWMRGEGRYRVVDNDDDDKEE